MMSHVACPANGFRTGHGYSDYVQQSMHHYSIASSMTVKSHTPQLDHALIAFKNGFSQTTIDKIKPRELFKLLQNFEASDISLQTADGYPLLHVAIQFKFDDEAIQIMDKGANSTQLEKDGQTALHLATALGLTKVVTACMYRGASLQSRNAYGKTPYQVALDNKNYALAISLYTTDQNIDQTDAEGMTAFLKACQKAKEFPGVARSYASYGANIHAITPKGETALHLAATNSDHELARYLLKKGISKEKQDSLGMTALTIAIAKQDLEMIELLAPQLIRMIPGGQKVSAADAAKSGNQAVVLFWLSQGLNINADVEKGYTMLHLAAKNKQGGLTQFLISQKASLESLNIGQSSNSSPLICALENGLVGMVQMLLKAGANPNAKNTLGEYPLHIAINIPNPESRLSCVRMLVDAGATVNHSELHVSFLFLAFLQNCMATFTFLQGKGAFLPKNESSKLIGEFKKRVK